jgi:hypothetical protein
MNNWFLRRMNVQTAAWDMDSSGTAATDTTAILGDVFGWIMGIPSSASGDLGAFTEGALSRGGPGRDINVTDIQGQTRPVSIGATPPTVSTLNSFLGQLHNLPPDQLYNFTSRLYAAGLYPDRAYAKGAAPPNGTVVTENDIAATVNLISTAQRYVQRNPDGSRNVIKTIDEIINESIAAGTGADKAKGLQGPGQVYQVTTSDPATLREQVTKVGQILLGRALGTDEQAALVDQMLAAERGPQESMIQAGQMADTGGDIRLATARVDAEARLREQIRNQNPDEAQAYAEMNYVNIMREMIGGGSGGAA